MDRPRPRLQSRHRPGSQLLAPSPPSRSETSPSRQSTTKSHTGHRRHQTSLTTSLCLATLAAAVPVSAITLPYTTTTILLSGSQSLLSSNSDNHGLAYIFTANGDNNGVDLLAINTSSTLDADSFKPITLTSGLPFVTKSKTSGFAPTLLENGTLAVLAGDCAAGATEEYGDEDAIPAVWSYAPSFEKDGDPKGVWTKHSTQQNLKKGSIGTGPGIPYLLGSSLSFSSQIYPSISDPVIYIYGGMCPFSNSTASTWQASAHYSNRMLKISSLSSDSSGATPSTPTGGDEDDVVQPENDSNDGTDFTISNPQLGGPPIPEAGFTFTSLVPSITNRSGIVTQQTSHVLLGGHTQHAFVNMSTAAIWSLPAETWSFVSINPPAEEPAGSSSGSEQADLVVLNVHQKRSKLKQKRGGVTTVDSRSGHSTVLSEDGGSLVILGGWVGDVSQPAEPQLVVIKIGASYDDWSWEIPEDDHAQIFEKGEGLYGHGAVVLPGNVMMVYGGWEIKPPRTASSKAKVKRWLNSFLGLADSNNLEKRQSPIATTSPRFFNMTSQSWATTYTNPRPDSNGNPTVDIPPTASDPSDSSKVSPNLGLTLGLALGLGIPLVAIIFTVLFCLWRRRQRRRAQRDQTIRSLSMGMPPSVYGTAFGGSIRHSISDWGENPSSYTNYDNEMAEQRSSGFGFQFPWNTNNDSNGQGTRSLSGGYQVVGQPGHYQPSGPPAANSTGSGVGRLRNARGLYIPTNGMDFSPPSGRGIANPNGIHPIYEEADEDDEYNEKDGGDLGASGRLISPEYDDDPFITPAGSVLRASAVASTSYPPTSSGSGSGSGGSMHEEKSSPGLPPPEIISFSPKQGQDQDPEVRGWKTDVDVADAVLAAKISRHGSVTTTHRAATAASLEAATHQPVSPTSARAITSPPRRASNKSTKSRRASNPLSKSTLDISDDSRAGSDHRTGSNLSDKSAFSFISGREHHHASPLSPAHHQLRVAAAAGEIPKPGSSGSGKSGNSSHSGNSGSNHSLAASSASSGSHSGSTAFASARSNLPTPTPNFNSLQAEGADLLFPMSGGSGDNERPGGEEGGEQQESEEDWEPIPSSPSKTRRNSRLDSRPRSWLGSLKRMLSVSGGSGGSGSFGGDSSPTKESLLHGNEASGFDNHHLSLIGLNPGALGLGLVRRKQGREAWDNNGEESSARQAAGGENNNATGEGGQGDDWDVEKMVEQRLVQVMFTVPKERLRVVNAEIEREESILICDVNEEGSRTSRSGTPSSVGKGKGKGKERAEGQVPDTIEIIAGSSVRKTSGGSQQQSESDSGTTNPMLTPASETTGQDHPQVYLHPTGSPTRGQTPSPLPLLDLTLPSPLTLSLSRSTSPSLSLQLPELSQPQRQPEHSSGSSSLQPPSPTKSRTAIRNQPSTHGLNPTTPSSEGSGLTPSGENNSTQVTPSPSPSPEKSYGRGGHGRTKSIAPSVRSTYSVHSLRSIASGVSDTGTATLHVAEAVKMERVSLASVSEVRSSVEALAEVQQQARESSLDSELLHSQSSQSQPQPQPMQPPPPRPTPSPGPGAALSGGPRRTRTRVLDLVEKFESVGSGAAGSRESSPAPSAVSGNSGGSGGRPGLARRQTGS
ncbi:hypothetical protein SMACR_00752 [Sordaria macrospora]|uniref:WGS project CABT00000000 data, contig 2.2 n=2 Tax=Sordaria macrospora TaxID=5147 RepID=F7VMZ6_SORMK|nr:uncharacterized protein SMAC_00752 [Sordaria macrospora k-hell]KAA8634762.1 hypothetical protein SMACR_00752 [Sordaria macrospora]WPJ61748.1 hypothetical protein SMAC4_00752 [Sordaria macrospora]CCC06725.1 unnamed protein product [Sordaria macrospora k-hell]